MRAAKDELRREMRDRRLALAPADAARRAAEATAHLVDLPGVAAARLVALYAPVRQELDTRAAAEALRSRGAQTAYPRIIPGRRELRWYLVGDEAALAPTGPLAIPEPPDDAPVVPDTAIDVFVVPGLAFDARGARLGWGRGFFDHALAAAPQALRVGFAYDFQLVPTVPESADDVRMDVLVTDTGARTTSARPLPPIRRVR